MPAALPGQTSGTNPTPVGRKVRAEAELVAMDRRKLTFKVRVFDEVEQVSEAEHERFVIDVDKYIERLKKKIGGWNGGKSLTAKDTRDAKENQEQELNRQARQEKQEWNGR